MAVLCGPWPRAVGGHAYRRFEPDIRPSPTQALWLTTPGYRRHQGVHVCGENVCDSWRVLLPRSVPARRV